YAFERQFPVEQDRGSEQFVRSFFHTNRNLSIFGVNWAEPSLHFSAFRPESADIVDIETQPKVADEVPTVLEPKFFKLCNNFLSKFKIMRTINVITAAMTLGLWMLCAC